MTDFRSDRMPSPEGLGQAQSKFRKAWEAYNRTVQKVAGPVLRPAVEPAALWWAGKMVEDLVGFWLLWQLEGGFEGLQEMGMSRSAIYRRVQSFRKHFGEHPDTFQMPGVTIELDEYLQGRKMIGPHGARAKQERRQQQGEQDADATRPEVVVS